jgi:GntR family transcriptional regulator, transcriptional repressor for pyruvate dehydrogenase complex
LGGAIVVDWDEASAGIRVPKTAELVARHLRRQIVRGELKDGDFLPSESAIIERYQISRPTLREAFRILESESLINVRRGARGGARILAPTSEAAARYAGSVLQFEGATLSDLLAARGIIEPPAIGLMAAQSTRDAVKLLRATVQEAELSSIDPLIMVKCENDFHHQVVRLSGNQTLTLLSRIIDHILDQATVTYVASNSTDEATRSKHLTKAQRSHEKLVDMIEARDAAGAEEFWRRHLLYGGQALLKGLNIESAIDVME